jgi:hypothetical protein
MLEDVCADVVEAMCDSQPLLRHLLTRVGKDQISMLVGLLPSITPLA